MKRMCQKSQVRGGSSSDAVTKSRQLLFIPPDVDPDLRRKHGPTLMFAEEGYHRGTNRPIPLCSRTSGNHLTIRGAAGPSERHAALTYNGVTIATMPHFDSGPTSSLTLPQGEVAPSGLAGDNSERTVAKASTQLARERFLSVNDVARVVGWALDETESGVMYCPGCECMY